MSDRLGGELALDKQSTSVLEALKGTVASQEAIVLRGRQRISDLEERISYWNARLAAEDLPQGTSEERYNRFRDLQLQNNIAPERVFAVDVSGIIEYYRPS